VTYGHAERNLAATRLVIADTMRLLIFQGGGDPALVRELESLRMECIRRSSKRPTDGQ
jgi:hypothetical protein